MNETKQKFEIDFLDHVAIQVKDLETSVKWYEKVLGLKKYQLKAWGPYPIFMLANKSGVALFPMNSPSHDESRRKSVDHFAFNVSNENFDNAVKWFEELNLLYSIQDHHYFKSIYTKDPDDHVVELTTLLVDEDSFYSIS